MNMNKGIGINNKGKKIVYPIDNGILDCSYQNLISIEIPIGVKTVSCENNNLTELLLPATVKDVFCYNNSVN